MAEITGILREDRNTFLVEPHSIILRMRNVSDESYRENKKTFYVPKIFNRAFYEIMWCRAGQATDYSMLHAHCKIIPKCKNAISECVIFIAFPLQKCWHERA